MVPCCIARETFHDIKLGILVGERNSRDHVGTEINAQDKDGRKSLRNLQDHKQEEWSDLRDI